MTDQDKLFNIIKFGCELITNDYWFSPYYKCNDDISLSFYRDPEIRIYDRHMNYLLIISFDSRYKKIWIMNDFTKPIEINNDILSMDLTQYVLYYDRFTNNIEKFNSLIAHYESINTKLKEIINDLRCKSIQFNKINL